MRITVNELYIRQHIKREKLVPVDKHPYFRALNENNGQIYTEYVSKSKYQSGKVSGSWTGFSMLYENIKRGGFDFVSYHPLVVKRIDGKWTCVGGKHRMCMLRQIYGPGAQIEVIDHKIVNVFAQETWFNRLKKMFM
jgi:hypothetical protein